jgi:hypothetical protein
VGEDLAAVAHQGGECERLAAGAGAEVADLHARRGAREAGGELGPFVLDLVVAVEELGRRSRGEAAHVHGGGEADGVGRPGAGGDVARPGAAEHRVFG